MESINDKIIKIKKLLNELTEELEDFYHSYTSDDIKKIKFIWEVEYEWRKYPQ